MPKQHVADAREMLERTRQANLPLKLKKCAFVTQQVDILGHRVAHSRVEPNDQHRE
jgi:hypothetical protein